MGNPLSFYFFSSRTAIRFHIARQLLARGWQETLQPKEAVFSDDNLTLNDEISKNLEYKHLLAQLMSRYCPNRMPLSYWLNDENCTQVFAKMMYDHYLINNQMVDNVPGLKWILKPSMLNNGDQIHLFNNVAEIKKHYASAKRLGGDHVLQRYVPDPDLILDRKYTLRIAAVLTNYAGVFLYNQGYVNISAFPFSLEDGFKNRKAHITNYVLDGEFAHIEQRSTQRLTDFDSIFQQMTQIISCVIKGLLKESPHYLAPAQHKVFEIFGFDFIKDQQGKVWLLEINQGPDAPTFEENMLDDILWNKFWQDIIEDFVLPIALNTEPKNHYKHFKQVLSAKECYPAWRKYINCLRGVFCESK